MSFDDHRLAEELRRLPRIAASPEFTTRVLERAAAADARARRRRRQWLGVGGTGVLAAALVLLWWASPLAEVVPGRSSEPPSGVAAVTPPGAPADRSADALDREMAELRRELEQLRRLAAVRDAVIAIPGAGEYDYFIDLRPVLLEPSAGGTTPASLGGRKGR